MILIIENNIEIVKSYFGVETIENLGVSYNRLDHGDIVTVIPQKVVLNEVDMNTFFDEVFTYATKEVIIEYAGLGGEGCDFSLSMKTVD